MSELIAWGDESVQRQGGIAPTYYVGVCICGLEEDEVRRRLLTPIRKKIPKLHWRDMTPSEKRRSIPVVESLSLPHIVAAAAPLDNIKPDRARHKCLERLLPELELQYGVTRLVMESREATQDERDLACVRGLRSRGFIRRLRVDFMPGESDARLWIPDQVLGAIGDAKRGGESYSGLIASVHMLDVDLSDQ